MHVKTSKKLMLAAAVVIMLNLNSCGKYDDGPAFSLKTKTSRLVGEWEIVEINGVNQTSNTSFEFDDDGDFSVNSSYSYNGSNYNYSSKGEWEWEDGKEITEWRFYLHYFFLFITYKL